MFHIFHLQVNVSCSKSLPWFREPSAAVEKVLKSCFQYVGVFHVHVVLRNDQTPTRVVDKEFQVVEGGQKLLTSDDLLFVDLVSFTSSKYVLKFHLF